MEEFESAFAFVLKGRGLQFWIVNVDFFEINLHTKNYNRIEQ